MTHSRSTTATTLRAHAPCPLSAARGCTRSTWWPSRAPTRRAQRQQESAVDDGRRSTPSTTVDAAPLPIAHGSATGAVVSARVLRGVRVCAGGSGVQRPQKRHATTHAGSATTTLACTLCFERAATPRSSPAPSTGRCAVSWAHVLGSLHQHAYAHLIAVEGGSPPAAAGTPAAKIYLCNACANRTEPPGHGARRRRGRVGRALSSQRTSNVRC